MRGKVFAVTPSALLPRITPAYAGKSPAFRQSLFLCLDHPRLCGEKDSSTIQNFSGEGSPPPMRGKVVDIVYQLQQEGITPAYAGKRPSLEITMESS